MKEAAIRSLIPSLLLALVLLTGVLIALREAFAHTGQSTDSTLVWTQQTGTGQITPACASSNPTTTCNNDGSASATITYSWTDGPDDNSFTGNNLPAYYSTSGEPTTTATVSGIPTCVGETITLSGGGAAQSSSNCDGSFVLNGLASNTTYTYTLTSTLQYTNATYACGYNVDGRSVSVENCTTNGTNTTTDAGSFTTNECAAAPTPAIDTPNVPTLSCPASAIAGQAASITVSGTDLAGEQIRYGLDWVDAGSVNDWEPPTGYVDSGTSETLSHTFATAGTYTVNALVQNTDGNSSGWASCTITVTAPTTPPPTCPDNSPAPNGDPTQCSCAQGNTSACTATTPTCPNGVAAPDGDLSNCSSTVSCSGTNCATSCSLSATPTTVSAGAPTQLSWSIPSISLLGITLAPAPGTLSSLDGSQNPSGTSASVTPTFSSGSPETYTLTGSYDIPFFGTSVGTYSCSIPVGETTTATCADGTLAPNGDPSQCVTSCTATGSYCDGNSIVQEYPQGSSCSSAPVACPQGQTCELSTDGTTAYCQGASAGELLSFSVNPTLVKQGNPVTVAWSAQNVIADTCQVTATESDTETFQAGASSCTDRSGGVAGLEKQSCTSQPINGQTTFTLSSCEGLDGTLIPGLPQSITVNVVPRYQEE